MDFCALRQEHKQVRIAKEESAVISDLALLEKDTCRLSRKGQTKETIKRFDAGIG